MKILYDSKIFNGQSYGGISRYFYEVIKNLNKTSKYEAELALIFSNNNFLTKDIKHYNFFPNHNFKGKVKIISEINEAYSIYKIIKHNYDIFHPTYYYPYFLNYLANKPFVVTVYDMIHEKFPQFFSTKDKTTKNKRILVERANKVIAISQNTKNDLCDIFNIDPNKVEVVHLGSSLETIKSKEIKNVPKNYFLYVGTRRQYKNFDFLLKSIADILKVRDVHLICAGSSEFSKYENELINNLKLENNIIHINIADEELKYLYENAIAFIFPSLYEGFGIPIIESFSCGCPVICSNASSFPEVAGNAALYFEPKDETSIKSTLEKIFDVSLRNELIKKARERSKEFTWEKCAEQMKLIYEKILWQ